MRVRMMTSKEELWPVIVRGAFGRCPHCGQGKLFQSYLKQVEDCAACGEKLGHIRADDGPAWLTILLVGHILAPFLLNVLPNVTWPDWVIMAVIMSLTLILTLWLLPRSKGVFIGLIWRSGCIGSEK
ncbi:MAG: hypothetical protein K0R63_458 [Rickettsiales bacterium]|jgi:uncharacterized protein (DUF983 family)|nr:hypothetical protein [Rickettsiales bacterium]